MLPKILVQSTDLDFVDSVISELQSRYPGTRMVIYSDNDDFCSLVERTHV